MQAWMSVIYWGAQDGKGQATARTLAHPIQRATPVVQLLVHVLVRRTPVRRRCRAVQQGFTRGRWRWQRAASVLGRREQSIAMAAGVVWGRVRPTSRLCHQRRQGLGLGLECLGLGL